MKKRFLLTMLTLLLYPALSYPQKAYEAYYYQGKVDCVNIQFTLGDGYLGACEIHTINNRTHQKATFTPEYAVADEAKRMKFFRFNGAGARDPEEYFILEGMEEPFRKSPARVHGSYYFKEKVCNFTLYRYK